MNHKVEEWIQNKVKPLLTKERMILMVLGGILILVISLPTGGKKEGENKNVVSELSHEVWQEEDKKNNALTETGSTLSQDREYLEALEKELRSILSMVDGAGDVRVMITLEHSSELVLEKDEKSLQKQTTENSSNLGKTGREVSTEISTVYQEDERSKTPFVVKQVYPRIEGVIVLAQGVGHGTVRAELTEAVQALFGIEAHRIKVLKLRSNSSFGGIE